jgi:hypothetical protein
MTVADQRNQLNLKMLSLNDFVIPILVEHKKTYM